MKFETSRVYLREFEIADKTSVLAFNSDPLVTRFTGDAGMVTTLSDAESVIKEIWLKEYQLHGYGRWAVVDKETDDVIGFAGA